MRPQLNSVRRPSVWRRGFPVPLAPLRDTAQWLCLRLRLRHAAATLRSSCPLRGQSRSPTIMGLTARWAGCCARQSAAYRGLLALASPWLAASATDYCRSVGKSGLPFLQRGTGLALFSEQVLGLDLSLGEGHADAVGIIG